MCEKHLSSNKRVFNNILTLDNYMYGLICYVTLYYEKDKK